jgi:hypothetical protein
VLEYKNASPADENKLRKSKSGEAFFKSQGKEQRADFEGHRVVANSFVRKENRQQRSRQHVFFIGQSAKLTSIRYSIEDAYPQTVISECRMSYDHYR